MDFWRKTQGAVSIFLVIILVPMMTVAALFVDASKVRLAKGVAESAGNLTLNTALTDYDTQLKDLYGLFATVQNTDELYEKLESYYKTCIVSSGVDAADATDITQQLMQLLSGVEQSGDTADILKMELVDYSMNKRSDISLANAAVLKKQIVEFMKYRAPINTGLSFLSSIKTFTTLSKQTDLVDKRQDYYEAEGDVLKKLHEAWKHINEYNKLPLITDEQYFEKMKEDFNSSTNGWETKYRDEVNKKTIMDLYDTQNYKDFHCTVTMLNHEPVLDAAGNTTYTSLWRFVYAEAGANPMPDYRDYYNNYNEDSLPSKSTISSLIKNFYSYMNTAQSYLADVQVILDKEDEINNGTNDAYLLQVLVQAMRKGLPNYASSLMSVYSCYQQLKNAMIWVEAYEDEDKQEIKDETVSVNGHGSASISSWFSNIESEYDAAMSKGNSVLGRFTRISENNIGSKTNTSGVSQTVNEIGKKVADYVKNLEDGAKELEAASKYLGEAETLINEKLNPAKTAWSQAANDEDLKNTAMARQDKAEIDEVGKYLNNGEMTKMIQRVDNVSENLRKTVGQIKNYKFDGVFIGDIQSYDKVKSTLEDKIGKTQLKNVDLSQSKLIAQANSWFEWTSERVDVDWIDDSGTQPKLHGNGTDKLNFYSYMYNKFNELDEANPGHGTTEKKENEENGTKLFDKIKSSSSSSVSKDAANGNDAGKAANELYTLANRPSTNIGTDAATASGEIKTGDNAAQDTSGSLSSMFKVLGNAAKDFGEDLRDKLYVMDYIMSMFSYDTIENEAAKNNKGDTIQSLTLVPIDKDHNAAYAREVEYIIYGGKNSSNVTKAYGSIYAIRLGFNLVYAFMDSEIRDTALAIATPISAATLGIVPVPLIQAVIIVGISCIESGLDLAQLKQGEKVPLFKNKETWCCSVSGLMNVAKSAGKYVAEKAIDYALDEGTKKLGEVLDMTNDELDKYIDSGTDDLTGYVGSAYDTLITRHANLAIQKLTTLVDSALEQYAMDPAFNMQDYISGELDQWVEMNNNGSNDMGYTIKKEAVKIIKEQFIQKMIDAMQKAKNAVNAKVEEMGKELQEKISELRRSILRAITQGSEKVKAYKEQMIEQVKASMKEGAGSLKNTLNEQLDGVFGAGSGGEFGTATDNTGLSSLLSFAYSDYMRLFLMIGLYTNEEAILLRTGDAIQANMVKQTSDSKYRLSQASAYVELSVEIQVKPLLLPLPIFAGVENNPATDTKWYTIGYEGIKGY